MLSLAGGVVWDRAGNSLHTCLMQIKKLVEQYNLRNVIGLNNGEVYIHLIHMKCLDILSCKSLYTCTGFSLMLSLLLPPLSLSLSLPPSLPLQFHIPNTTTANYVRTVQLPLDVASLENVTKMVASDNGDYIFAMTPSRVSTLN